jgi:hypothetical protein
MLKIKDNVDLKELEKFGFEYENEEECVGSFEDDDYEEYFYEWYEWNNEDGKCNIKVKSNNEIVLLNIDDYYNDDVLDCIYDLIQAGLVEKVEG